MRWSGTLAAAVVLAGSVVAVAAPATPAAAGVPAGFTEVVAFGALDQPTAVRFAPDGRVFVAEKRGTIQMFDSVDDPTPTQIADLRTEVYNYWDRGLLGLAVDPGFPARPYLYALYTYDGAIGETAPRWGTGQDSDPCPTPPGPTTDGCVVSSKLVKLELTGTSTVKTDLIHDWCQQFPSHSVGTVTFGPDGALYVSGGDGASFDYADYGQSGNPPNPCGDPPGPAGTRLQPPTAEGGSLRAQDLRTPGDPVTLDGTVIRVSPVDGAPLPDNPNARAADVNARRIIAYGLRNPFRMAFRPGTSELWLGDVGSIYWEEINRIASPTAGVLNFGFPCYEGVEVLNSFASANLDICRNLYADPAADTKPFYAYAHGQPVSASDTCSAASGSSISGLSFEFYAGGPYPPEYDGALFVADYSRNCIWVIQRGANGQPDPTTVRPFVSPASGPVDLELSPSGELYYADLSGTVRRIVYGTGPTGCASGQFRAEYFADPALTGDPASSGCEPGPLAHDWGLGGPAGVGPDGFSARWRGTFDFPTAGDWTFTAEADDGIRVSVDGTPLIDEWRAPQASTFIATRTLTAGAHEIRVEYFDASGAAVAALHWAPPAVNAPPQPQILTPAVGTTWTVGQPISFTGVATDPEDGGLPASALSWEMDLQHCPAACHTHVLQQWTGVSGGSITAPDHEYPAYLELRLTATDSAGRSTTVTRRLDPRTAAISVLSQPPGLQMTLGSRTAATPFTAPLIVGSRTALSAPTPQTLAGGSYAFARWSDGGAATHPITVGSSAASYTATYTATSCPAGQYRAQYFANKTLSGAAATTRCEAAPLNQNWGSGGPPGTPVNNFSARWTGTFTFPAGSRTFTATSDNGIRVWLDGVKIIDHWGSSGTTRKTRSVPAGAHTVRIDYWEGTGSASARVSW